MAMRIVGLVQARMGSSRIPGKVLEPIGGVSMVQRIVERVAAARNIADVAIVTSTASSDDRLVEFARRQGIAIFRGPVDDIITRLHVAAAGLNSDAVVRVWGDCPFVDAGVLDDGVDLLVDNGYDFVTNAAFGRRTYPPGLDFEGYRSAVLAEMNEQCTVVAEREFPYEFVRRRPERFRAGFLDYAENLSDLHLTVDYPEDLAAARAICAVLESGGRVASFGDLVALLRARPDLAHAFSERARNIEYKAYLDGRATAGAA
jgi:spore coat polysaccharide biosynthesis protein SpsF